MNLYLVRLSDSQSGEYFFKIGVTAHSTRGRFAYGSTKVVDSNLSLGDKLRMVSTGTRYIPDCEYSIEEIHSVAYRVQGDAYLGEQKLLALLAPISYMPQKHMSGSTECFRPAPGKEAECSKKVIAIMDRDCEERNANSPTDLEYALLGMSIRVKDPKKRHLAILEKYQRTRDASAGP